VECGFRTSPLDVQIKTSQLISAGYRDIKNINTITIQGKTSLTNSKGIRLLFQKVISVNFNVSTNSQQDFYTRKSYFPYKKINMSDNFYSPTNILIDTFIPMGLGQRSLIAAPPKVGKTRIIESLFKGMDNTDNLEVYFLLVGERPEEETHLKDLGQYTVSSTFDDTPEDQIKYTSYLMKYIQARAMSGRNCFILMDSLTRVIRSYNAICSSEKRTLSGGLEYKSLLFGKKLMGMARVLKGVGSVGIVATCLVNTESKMDDAIYQEFKGTCNSEIILDQDLSEKSLYPAINLNKSRTRNDNLLNSTFYEEIIKLRRLIQTKNATESFINILQKVKGVDDFYIVLNDLIMKNNLA